MEKTIELIPINLIENVIYDNKHFLDFIRSTDEYLGYTTSGIKKSIIDYLSYYNNKKYPQDIEDRIMYLKTFSQNYQETITFKTSKELIIKILNDHNSSNKLNNYEEHKSYFDDFKIEDIITDIDKYLKENNGTFCKNEDIKYTIPILKNKYGTNAKEKFIGYKSQLKVSEKIKSIISNELGNHNDDFYIARKIYLILCEKCKYNPKFLASDDVSKESKIYNECIDQEKLNVICKNFSELYASVLNLYNIEALVTNDYHKTTLIKIGNTIIEADATNSYTDESGLLLNDLTRVKLDSTTMGYYCITGTNKFEQKMNSMNNNEIIITADIVKKLREYYQQDDITTINKILMNIEADNLEGMEWLAYISSVLKQIIKRSVYITYGFNKNEVILIAISMDSDEILIKSKNSDVIITNKENVKNYIDEETKNRIINYCYGVNNGR